MRRIEFAEKIAELVNGEVRVIEKNGVSFTGITPKEGGDIKPTVYIDEMYDSGKFTPEEAAEKVQEAFNAHTPPISAEDVREFLNYEKAKNMLRIRLRNKYGTYEVSQDAAADGFDDLLLVPYIDNIDIGDGIGAVMVTESLLNMWGVTAEEVIRTARENSDNQEYIIKSLNQYIAEEIGMPLPVDVEESAGSPMVFITNEQKMNGAYGAIAARKRLEEMYPNGYILFPSSIHEMIAIGAEAYNPEMELMVREINETTVDPVDRLGDHIYVVNAEIERVSVT